MIYQQVDFNSFVKAFKEADRGDQFSIECLKMLYDYIEDLSNDMGQDLELDVIALCCQYAEYNKEDFLNDYSFDGIDCIDSLEQAILDGDIDCIIDYHLGNDILLVNSNY